MEVKSRMGVKRFFQVLVRRAGRMAACGLWGFLSVSAGFLTAGACIGASAADGPSHPLFDTLEPPTAKHDVRLVKSRMVPMRDGVLLSADVYLPEGVDGPLPVVMIRTPYDKAFFRAPLERGDKPVSRGPIDQDLSYHWHAQFFAAHGYAVVVQDHRGRLESQGEFFRYPATDGPDGYDTIEWIKEQPWSNGRVGTIGCSYLGETQHMLAAQRHPNHVTAIARSGASTLGAGQVWNFGFTRSGVTEFAAALSWNYRRAGNFAYGPPPGVDREAFFSGPHARFYRPQPVIDGWGDEGFQERVIAAMETLPAVRAMEVLGQGAVPSGFEDWLRYADEPQHPYWGRQGLITDEDRFNTPTLHMSSWYDSNPNSVLRLFRQFRENAESDRARDNQYLIMSPATHCAEPYATRNTVVGDRPVGNAFVEFPALYLAWFDHWLKEINNGLMRRLPKVTSFSMNADGGEGAWRTADAWPLPGTAVQEWFLDSMRGANTRKGDGLLSPGKPGAGREAKKAFDQYRYDPGDPAPTVGGSICCTGETVKEGGVDQREVEMREDMLVYTSEALTEPVEVAGPIEVVLHVSSSARDTDFVAKLVDVYPDGTAYILQEGVIRARWREGLDRKVFMEEGEVYEVRVDLEATHNYFAPGHRIRLDITSASFPRFERNLNTGGANYDESEYVVAENRVHHTTAYPSRVRLPVLQSVSTPSE